VLGKLIPESVHGYVHEHPKVLVWGSAALVAFSLYNLVDSIGLYHKAKMIVGELQREASEALGG